MKQNVVDAVNNGWFKVKVYKDDGKEGVIASVAEVSTQYTSNNQTKITFVLFCSSLGL